MNPTITAICALWLAAPQQGAQAGRELYYRALERVRAGQTAKAIGILSDLVERQPDDPFADDALLEMARLHEEALGEPSRAVDLYRQLVDRFPHSRLVRRARARISYLGGHLDQGDGVLSRFESIRRSSSRDAVDRMRDLLQAHPDFSLKPDGLCWMASRLADAGELDRARAIWERVLAEHPEHEAAGLALQARAQLELSQGNVDAAERAYQWLERMPGEIWQAAGQEGLLRLQRHRSQDRWKIAALLVWALAAVGLWLAWLLLSVKPLRWQTFKPPAELIVFSVIMLALVVITWGRALQARNALLWLTGLSAVLILPNGWLLRSWRPRAWLRCAWVSGLVIAWAAAVYASVALAGMVGQVAHTLLHGTD
ncbi:MAG: tetratricopeptide repeat protein [Deltaproteobacteria bacterium]|nr:tetratricopeptide repeat protein [Deltaproteobacteria bacterium]